MAELPEHERRRILDAADRIVTATPMQAIGLLSAEIARLTAERDQLRALVRDMREAMRDVEDGGKLGVEFQTVMCPWCDDDANGHDRDCRYISLMARAKEALGE